MLDSGLHHVAIDQLRNDNPAFYREYLKLVENISGILDSVLSQNPQIISLASFTETYDANSGEAVLQLIMDTPQGQLNLHIYVHQDSKFVIGKSGGGLEARSADAALLLIQAEVAKLATV